MPGRLTREGSHLSPPALGKERGWNLMGEARGHQGQFLPKSESCLDIWAEMSRPFFSQLILGMGMPSAWHCRLAAAPGSWACDSG